MRSGLQPGVLFRYLLDGDKAPDFKTIYLNVPSPSVYNFTEFYAVGTRPAGESFCRFRLDDIRKT